MCEFDFEALVDSCFTFLETVRGYRKARSMPSEVRYASGTVTIAIVFDRERSYELAVLISRNGSHEPPFSIYEILLLHAIPGAKEYSLIQISSREKMAEWLDRLADALKQHSMDCVEGDPAIFTRLAAQRARESMAYSRERELCAARESAARAWLAKDYDLFIKALDPVRNSLSAEETAKLDYARLKSST